MELTRVPINDLNEAPYNPRIDLKPGDPVYENLKRSVETFGYLQPVIVNRRNHTVVGGHQRLKVLQDLGHEQVDVVFVDLPVEQEKALNLTLNKTVGEWDEPKLARLLQEFEGFGDLDIQLTGFDQDEIGDLVSRVLDGNGPTGSDDAFDPDAVLDLDRPAVTQVGELLELGRHRLLCGDCTKVRQVRRLMSGQRAVLFATDPPYLVGYDGTNHPGRSKRKPRKNSQAKTQSPAPAVTWDDPESNPKLYDKFIRVAVAEAITPHAAWYCWHASRRQAMVERAWAKFGAFAHQTIIWAKNRPVLNRSWYTWQHEPCFFGWVRPNRPRRVAKEVLSSVWQIPTNHSGQQKDHPTSKPVDVFAIPMRQHTRRGEVCYEPFCGSGSQLVAAEQLGRRCFALEISPHYCDVIVRRWINLVGEDHTPRDLVKRYRRDPKQETAA